MFPVHRRPFAAPLSLAALILGAWPALAQDSAPTCSGQPAEWLGGSAEASDISQADQPLSLSTTAQTSPYASFRVSASMQPLRLEAQSDGDPSLRLETPEGDLVAENDDAVGLNSRIEQSLGPGDYCIRLVPVGEPRLTATVALSRPDQPALLSEPADMTIAACTPDMPARDLAQGPLDDALPVQVQTGPGVEYLRLSFAAARPFTLRATSRDLDPNVILFDAEGTQIAANDDADGLNSRLDFPSGLEGEYCLGVAPLSAGEGAIEVSLAALDRDRYLRDAWRRAELAPPEGSGIPVQRIALDRDAQTVVLHDGSAQWLDFVLERETMLIVSAYGALVGVDARLVLFADSGAVAAEDDDGAGGTDARIGPVLLAPGRYRLAVTDVTRSDQAGAPIRPVGLIFERFERVE